MQLPMAACCVSPPDVTVGRKHMAAWPVSEHVSARVISALQAQSTMHAASCVEQPFAMQDQHVPNAVPGA
jgi:hypothetical protein